jgi:pimeloyl-ACP methyl ester carboxylesterase
MTRTSIKNNILNKSSLLSLVGYLLRTAFTLAALSLTGCSLFLRSTPTPIPTQTERVLPTATTSTLIVFLPGRGGSMADFERQGFLSMLREAGVKADTLAVDAHLGYYINRTIIDRLWTDVLQPARQKGYQRIVLVGVSLGGVGTLFCEREHPGAADALVLLGPYLGDKAKLFEKIAAAGGPAAWATGRDLYADKVEEQLWTFLGMRSATLPPTWLLYGRQDSLATGHRLFAGLLPAIHVASIDGAHDWPTWRALWRDVCFNSDLFIAEKGDVVAPR